jgi:hypothetical protein
MIAGFLTVSSAQASPARPRAVFTVFVLADLLIFLCLLFLTF